MRKIINAIQIDNFRKIKQIDPEKFAKRINVISGHNGVGKSSIMSLIASCCGTNDARINGTKFQPEFNDYFTVDEHENYKDYLLFLDFIMNVNDSELEYGDHEFEFAKRISFKDDTNTGRGIRPIPRGSMPFNKKYNTIAEAVDETKYVSNGTETTSSRVKIPTIYVSMSRMMPTGETKVTVNKIAQRNKIIKNKLNDVYKKYYEMVLPNSFDEQNLSPETMIKESTNKERLFLPLSDANALTQSVGQDNLGSIISAIVDFYYLKKTSNDYYGGILCIDELDASLHPNAQKNLFLLLDKVSQELDLQIFVTSHSLTILKEIIKYQQQDEDNYKLIYFIGTKTPYISSQSSYRALKADLFQEQSYKQLNVNVYFEDDESMKMFNLLKLAAKELLDDQLYSSLPNLNLIPIALGSENLFKLPELDSHFKRCLIILDADSQYKRRIKIEEYLKDPNNIKNNLTPKKVKFNNIKFLPGCLSPEEYLYLIIREYAMNDTDHLKFWRGLNDFSETSLITSDKISNDLLIKDADITYKKIHDNKKAEELFDFAFKTNIFVDYFSQQNNQYELLNWFKEIVESSNKIKKTIESISY